MFSETSSNIQKLLEEHPNETLKIVSGFCKFISHVLICQAADD